MERKESAESVQRETGRVEAFSDGVFAIAITLLILEIHVPQPKDLLGPDGLTAALVHLWPSFLAFFLSFVFVLIAWINHHRLFTHIRRVDGTFLFLNGYLLMLISFVPFPTELLAIYIRRPEAKVAVALYTATNVLIATGYQFLWRYAKRDNRLLKRGANHALVARITREYNKSFPWFLVAFLLAFVNAPASLVLSVLILLFYAVTGFTAVDTDA